MSNTVPQLIAPLRRVRLVIALVVVNALVIPAVAWGIAKASPMSSTYVPGLVLATLAMGSAGALKAAQLTKHADLALSVSIVVVLQLLNIVAVPLRAGQIVSGASLSAWQIVKSLLAIVLAPLLVGLLIRLAIRTMRPSGNRPSCGSRTWRWSSLSPPALPPTGKRSCRCCPHG
jgi:BASS family bile acid:Na+ symporter